MATIDRRSGCKFYGCKNRADFGGYCKDHKIESSVRHKDYNKFSRNKEKGKVYGSARWKKLRLRVLQLQPLCSRCLGLSRFNPADMVDHTVGFTDKDDPNAWDIKKLYPLCNKCHAIVTEKEKHINFLTMSLNEAVLLKYGLNEQRKSDDAISI